MASPRDDVACGTFLKNVDEGEGVVVLQANVRIPLLVRTCTEEAGCVLTFARTRVPLVVDQS
jgi:hypothetical protein